MRYDLSLIYELCQEIGLSARLHPDRVTVDVGRGAVLCFQNAEREEDCLIGFLDTPWHTHDDLSFVDARGYYIELNNYLDVVVGLMEGRLLICERVVDGRIIDRWLVHSEFNDEFRSLDQVEQIVVRRAVVHPVKTSGRKKP